MLPLQEVTTRDYFAELQRLGINARAKNFLVFQGTIENLCTKSNKVLTTLFEEVSGSVAFKNDYEKSKADLAAAEVELALVYKKKQSDLAFVAEAKMKKKELKDFHKLEKDLEKHEAQLNLFKIYQCEETIASSRREQENIRQEILKIEESGSKLKASLKDMTTERTNIEETLAMYVLFMISLLVIFFM